jgi:hypothetical protein
MKVVGSICGHFVYFTAISSTLWLFSIFCGHFGVFSRFGMLCQGKSGNPDSCHIFRVGTRLWRKKRETRFRETMFAQQSKPRVQCRKQGDQIGRIFATLAFVYSGQFDESYRISPHFWTTFLLGKSFVLT